MLTATLCTFRIGGPAKVLLEPRCVGELVDAVCLCAQTKTPFAVIGKGSNVLFDDSEMETVLIRTTALDALRVLPEGKLHALCGASLSALAICAARAGFGDLAFACGIPGTVGGALFMNAGAYGSAILDVAEKVTALNVDSGKIETYFNNQLNNSYRNSVFQSQNTVILDATFRCTQCADTAAIFDKMRTLRAARRAAQPIHLPSAGSVFRRPAPHIFVSKIVDELGLKGMQIGGAQISPQHAGFIVNTGGATAGDVRTLITEIQNIVERERGFRPIPEIRFIPHNS